MRVNKLENQVEVLTDLIADNKKLKEKVELLTHLRRMDLEFLCILVWGYGIDKDKYNAMDKRIYSGYSTYKKHTYDWDWLMDYVADEEDTGAIFDRIELINYENEVKRDKEEKQRKELELYLKQKEEQKKKEEEEKIVLTLTPEIIEKAKNGELDETK
jgi:hypothetical protein